MVSRVKEGLHHGAAQRVDYSSISLARRTLSLSLRATICWRISYRRALSLRPFYRLSVRHWPWRRWNLASLPLSLHPEDRRLFVAEDEAMRHHQFLILAKLCRPKSYRKWWFHLLIKIAEKFWKSNRILFDRMQKTNMPVIIDSSMDHAHESRSFLNKQNNKYVISVTSSTLLITNYSLTTTTVTTNIVLGANNRVSCLPSGYTVC